MNGGLSGLKDEIIQLLKSDHRLAGLRLLREYSGKRDNPVRTPTLVTGIEQVETGPGALGGVCGVSSGQVLNGAIALVTLRFDFYLPQSAGDGHQLYEALCEVLLLSGAAPGFSKLWCKEMSFDASAMVNRLQAGAQLQVCLTSGGELLPIQGFTVRHVE